MLRRPIETARLIRHKMMSIKMMSMALQAGAFHRYLSRTAQASSYSRSTTSLK
jgi:hypothetical protein